MKIGSAGKGTLIQCDSPEHANALRAGFLLSGCSLRAIDMPTDPINEADFEKRANELRFFVEVLPGRASAIVNNITKTFDALVSGARAIGINLDPPRLRFKENCCPRIAIPLSGSESFTPEQAAEKFAGFGGYLQTPKLKIGLSHKNGPWFFDITPRVGEDLLAELQNALQKPRDRIGHAGTHKGTETYHIAPGA